MITVSITEVNDGVKGVTQVHQFDDRDDYDWFAEMHWRSTSTTSDYIFDSMTKQERMSVQSIWEEDEE
jgi:hypothetical protein